MFKPQFAPLVKAGTKRQTIRPMPKQLPKVGDHESWREWIGLPYRTKQRELARVELTEVQSVVIHRDGIEICPGTLRVCFFGEWNANRRPRLEVTAILDGFASWEKMRDWFRVEYELPFEGILIQAKDL
jgi:hypothetical protein